MFQQRQLPQGDLLGEVGLRTQAGPAPSGPHCDIKTYGLLSKAVGNY